MAEKTIGTDIAPPDLRAKITGRARYAEDFRADGMVFAKMLLSPMPHARVRSVDASRALAMDGVLGILRADEVPAAEGVNEPALTDEPKYEGEPILAVAAVDETTAAAAIEAIRVDLEPLPFVLDPLDSLRPGGPDARLDGNVFRGRDLETLKWPTTVFDEAGDDRLPMGEATNEWVVGDVETGFAAADVIVEDTIVHQSVTHHPMEPRSAMAYWQNGKLFLCGSTQSTGRCRLSVAGALGMEPEDVVMIGEYCGGGFGSKITLSPTMLIPALLSQKVNRPVMLRITRYEEHYVGRARCGLQGWARMGFTSDGRMTALDLYAVQDSGPYGRSSDVFTAGTVASLSYQPETMRFRGVPVYTNTPPKSAQRAPGGAQIVAMLEPLVDRAARELNIDRVEIRKVNAAGHDGWVGPNKAGVTSAFVREALDLGADLFNWEEMSQLSGQRNGTKVTGVGLGLSPFVGGSSGFDGLLVIRPDGKLYIHQGIGNLGTHSIADTGRAAADVLDLAWDQVVIVWGDTSKHLPYSSVQAGSQTTHAHTRANHAAASAAVGLLQEIAATDLGGRPSDYRVADGRVFRAGNRSAGLSFARAAQRAIELGGKYTGLTVPGDIHDTTKAAVAGLAGQGLVVAAKDNYPHEGSTYSWVISFARVELDEETGQVDIIDLVSSTDCGTVIHPRSLEAQTHGGVIQGVGMAKTQRWVFDPRWGIPFTKRFYTARPPGILDVPLSPKFAAVNLADPQTPIGAKGIGEPPVGAGEAAYVCAVADAMGGRCLCRTPLTSDMILAELEGRPRPYGLLEAHV
ncbi:MAG: xanthine dehydrogenase family protein molybdopterin-binding subunit [Longimicrobiales bacterium]